LTESGGDAGGVIDRQRVTRIRNGQVDDVPDEVAVEIEIRIVVNGKVVAPLTCSPAGILELAYGYLRCEGWILDRDEIRSLERHGRDVIVALHPAARDRARSVPTRLDQEATVSVDAVLETAREVDRRGDVFRRTGATHAAAIVRDGKIACFSEDISRQAVLEKAMGKAILGGVPLRDAFVFLTSRVSKAILWQIARCGIPVVAAISAPTQLAIDEADRLGIGLSGFVRGPGLTIYAHRERFVLRIDRDAAA